MTQCQLPDPLGSPKPVSDSGVQDPVGPGLCAVGDVIASLPSSMPLPSAEEQPGARWEEAIPIC